MEKSEIVFSKHTPSNTQQELQNILPMKKVTHFSKYLGMPTQMGRSKRQTFDYIQDKIWKKLNGWKEKQLSFAGRSTLIKAVAQAIPTYIMSCFLLPKNLCSHIEKMVCKFWWGNNPDKRKIHWVKWSQICKNKNKGGLGYRGLRAFNEALLAKQGWKCITQPEALLSKLYKAKYHPKDNFLNAKQSQSMSYTWRSILKASWVLKKGGLWTVGNGADINIWTDNWLPEQEGYKIWSIKKPNSSQVVVKDLILPISKSWNSRIIAQLFYPFESHQILNIPIVDPNSHDEFCWPKTNNGVYTVKSGYQAIQEWQETTNAASTSNNNVSNALWKTLWDLKIPPKFIHLMWRILHNALPVCNNLANRGIKCCPICPRCNQKLEDINHVFKDCTWSQQVWFASQLNIKMENLPHTSFSDWIINISPKSTKACLEQICAISYHMWKARNSLIFNKKEIPVWQILEQANQSISEYQLNLEKHPSYDNASSHRIGNELNWKPPPAGALKANVDAHQLGDGRWGLGWLVRNEDGRCLGAETKVVCANKAVDAEVMGIEAVIQNLSPFPNQKIIIETDAKVVVDAIHNKAYPRSYWGRRTKKVGNSLEQNPLLSVRWTRRSGNKVAHQLANWAAKEPNGKWSNMLPSHIVYHVQNDMMPP
jgi:ribonuclease HI